ncbi:MAG: hypothetical protein B7Y01_04815 [Xanthobacter sp. 17-67-6]|nr:MAG: hypothetical protein B7Z30_05115 [Rhizobiales bacterium 12-68-15]OYX88890.1 MAG: hypothetical protein B7Y84_07405 [Azorhizobium sp. 32-67-21]OYZ87896.1 MAG: hypothetical protein B7Y01_04815 [Xanthobacter sp. 17-67-6]
MLTPIPLLIIPLAIYNIIAFLTPGVAWTSGLAEIAMMSGVRWTLTVSDVFLALCLFVLLFEVMKATRISSRSIVDHILSLLLFVCALIEFLMVPQAGTSPFALLVAIMLLDVIIGFSVSIRVAQRDVALTAAPDQ